MNAQPRYARITGTGSALPGKPVSNADLMARGIDTSDEWIVERTGIRTRYLAEDGQSTVSLGTEAAQRALQMAGRTAADIDLIVLATSTPDYIFPSSATLIQDRLGAHANGAAFDVQAVCSGFLYALVTAEKFIRSGSHQRALVIGADVFSRILDWQDRGTCVLFGDGAGAVVLEAADAPGILAGVLHADGAQNRLLCVPGTVSHGQVQGDPFLRMDGQAVFRFAVKALSEVAQEALTQAGVGADSVDWLIPHQANLRIISATAKRLGLPMERVITTVAHHGNTSAASVPLALDEAVRAGQVRRGQRLLFEGIGGGFAWGAALVDF